KAQLRAEAILARGGGDLAHGLPEASSGSGRAVSCPSAHSIATFMGDPAPMRRTAPLLLALLAAPAQGSAQAAPAPAAPAQPAQPDTADHLRPGLFAGLRLRNLGPAAPSGRIGEVAIPVSDRNTWYVAVHSGGVWKTVNAGTTWSPVFDAQAAYSIGTVAVDPKNPLVVWEGTGENNSQRSVGYGDGVYKSTDGGKSWSN